MTNFNEFKNATAVKNEARKIAFEMIKTFFTEKLGEENVSIIGNNEIAICLETKDLADGSTSEICVTFKPTAKDYENRKTTKKTFEAFERLIEADLYEAEQQEKADKKAEKEKAKEKKIEADEKARKEKENKTDDNE